MSSLLHQGIDFAKVYNDNVQIALKLYSQWQNFFDLIHIEKTRYENVVKSIIYLL